MNSIIKNAIIFAAISVLLTSCSGDKNLNTGSVRNETAVEQLMSSNDDISYEVKIIRQDGVGQLVSYNNHLLFDYSEEMYDSSSGILVYSTSEDQTEKIPLNADILSAYEDNQVTSVSLYDNLILFSGVSSLRDEFGKISYDSFVGYYDLNTGESNIQLIKNDCIYQICLDPVRRRIICQSDNLLYSLDMSLNIIDSANISDILSELIETDCSFQVDMTVDNEGNIYLCIFDYQKNYVFKLNDSLDVLWSMPEDELNEFSGIVRVGLRADGSVFIYSADPGLYLINVIDKNSSETISRYEIPADGKAIITDASRDSDFIMLSDGYFELYNLDDDKPISTYKFNDCDYFSWNTYAFSNNNVYSVFLAGTSTSQKVSFVDGEGIPAGEYEITGLRCGNRYIYDSNGGLYAISENRNSIVYNSLEGVQYIDALPSGNFELCGVAENYLFRMEDSFELYSSEGMLISEFNLDVSEFLAFSDKSGSEEVYYVDSKGNLNSYNINSEKKTDIKSVNDLKNSDKQAAVYYDGGVHDFYIESDNHLYVYDIGNESLSEIACSPDIFYIRKFSGIIVINDSGVMAFKGAEGVYIITPVAEPADKEVLNIAFMAQENMLPYEYIQNYNETNNKYLVKVKKYGSNDELNKDISMGIIPDIFISDGDYSLKKYERMNMFTDLKTLLDNDPDINSDDYFENLISMYSDENKIYKIFPSFSAVSLGILGDTVSVGNISDSKDFYSKISENQGCLVNDYEDKTELLMNFLPFYINDYTDPENHSISFQTEEFKTLIDLTAKQSDISKPDGNGILTEAEFHSFVTISKLTDGCEKTLKIIGYPGKNGPYISVKPDVCYSISENCKNKDEAWSIVKDCFISGISGGSLSVCKKIYESDMENELKNKASKENIEELDRLIRAARIPFESDSNINSIITEEVQEYFSGDNTIDKTIDKIQKRVNIYINESMR